MSFLPIFEGNIFSHDHWFGHCPFFQRWLNTTSVKKLALCYTRNTIIFTSNLHCTDYLSVLNWKFAYVLYSNTNPLCSFLWKSSLNYTVCLVSLLTSYICVENRKKRMSLSWLSAGQREFGTGLRSVRFRYSKQKNVKGICKVWPRFLRQFRRSCGRKNLRTLFAIQIFQVSGRFSLSHLWKTGEGFSLGIRDYYRGKFIFFGQN